MIDLFTGKVVPPEDEHLYEGSREAFDRLGMILLIGGGLVAVAAIGSVIWAIIYAIMK